MFLGFVVLCFFWWFGGLVSMFGFRCFDISIFWGLGEREREWGVGVYAEVVISRLGLAWDGGR